MSIIDNDVGESIIRRNAGLHFYGYAGYDFNIRIRDMDIILGANGQVSRETVRILESRGRPVRRIVRAGRIVGINQLADSETVVADYFDGDSLKKAFAGGETLLLLTPESNASENMPADAETVFANYRSALKGSGIKRIIGLSSLGAQLSPEVGTLRLYAMLEQSLDGLDVVTYFVRPAYFYIIGCSPWMVFVKKEFCIPIFP